MASHKDAISARRPGAWPRRLRVAFEAIVTAFMQSYMAARSRAAASPSKIVRVQGELDEANVRIGLLEAELDIQRRRLASVARERRPRVLPDDRTQLLILSEAWGLSMVQAAKRFVLHRNTFATRTAVARAMQRRLDVFGEFYNDRPRQGIGGLTPNQKWEGMKRLKAKPIRAHDPQPEFTVTKRRYRGDHHLIALEVERKEVA